MTYYQHIYSPSDLMVHLYFLIGSPELCQTLKSKFSKSKRKIILVFVCSRPHFRIGQISRLEDFSCFHVFGNPLRITLESENTKK